jgi:hypothetical protein
MVEVTTLIIVLLGLATNGAIAVAVQEIATA